MVAERRVELHAGVEQRLVRVLELVDEVARPLAAVHVVAQHDDGVERELPVPRAHLRGDLVLRLVAGAVVADGDELERVLAVGDAGRRRSARRRTQPDAATTRPKHDRREQPTHAYRPTVGTAPDSTIDDQVGLGVPENQIAAHEPVFHAVGQLLEPLENQRRHGRERRCLRIVGVHARRRPLRDLLHRGKGVADRAVFGVFLDHLSELFRCTVEDVAGLGVAPRRPDALGEVRDVELDALGIVGLFLRRQLALNLLLQREIGGDPLGEVRHRLGLGVHARLTRGQPTITDELDGRDGR